MDWFWDRLSEGGEEGPCGWLKDKYGLLIAQGKVNPTDPQQRRPATLRTVVEFNGPGNNGSDIRNGVAYQIKTGDVVVIPAGTGHWFTKIDDHINYLMIRFDPDKVTPLRSETQSKEYLSKPAPRG